MQNIRKEQPVGLMPNAEPVSIKRKLAIYYLLYPLLLIRIFASGFKFKIKASDFLIIVIGAIHIAELVIVEDYTNTAKLLYVSATLF